MTNQWPAGPSQHPTWGQQPGWAAPPSQPGFGQAYGGQTGPYRPAWTPPAGGQQPGFGYPPPPPKKSNAWLPITCGCLSVGGVVGLVVLLLAAGLLADKGPTTTYTTYRTSLQTTATTTTTRPTPTVTTSRPTPSPTTSRPTTTAPESRTHPGGNYQNTTYRVPGAVQTTSGFQQVSRSEAERYRSANPLYSRMVAQPVNCPIDPISATMSVEQQKATANVYVNCLMTTWEPVFRSMGLTLYRPAVVYFSGSVNSPCGTITDEGVLGVYCSGSMTLYIPPKESDTRNSSGQITFTAEDTLAHEFGHHVQNVSRIAAGSWYRQSSYDKGTDGYLEENRRMELQAQCFSGVGLKSVAQSAGLTDNDFQTLFNRRAGFGPSTTHGNGQTRAAWMRLGWEATTLSACNTFTAPSTQVAP